MFAENVKATGVEEGLVEVVDDPAAAFGVADGFADRLNPGCGSTPRSAERRGFVGGSTGPAGNSMHLNSTQPATTRLVFACAPCGTGTIALASRRPQAKTC